MSEPRLRFRLYKTKPTPLHYLCLVTYLTSSITNNQAATGGLDDTDQPSTYLAVYSAPSPLFIELNHLQRVNAPKTTAPRRGRRRFRIANKLCESNPRLPCACVQPLALCALTTPPNATVTSDSITTTIPITILILYLQHVQSPRHFLPRQDSEY